VERDDPTERRLSVTAATTIVAVVASSAAATMAYHGCSSQRSSVPHPSRDEALTGYWTLVEFFFPFFFLKKEELFFFEN
jgi:hypothetical protein